MAVRMGVSLSSHIKLSYIVIDSYHVLVNDNKYKFTFCLSEILAERFHFENNLILF